MRCIRILKELWQEFYLGTPYQHYVSLDVTAGKAMAHYFFANNQERFVTLALTIPISTKLIEVDTCMYISRKIKKYFRLIQLLFSISASTSSPIAFI